MEELNKKLAEWAEVPLEERLAYNFPYDLNACFKWLVPKLHSDGYYIQLLTRAVDDIASVAIGYEGEKIVEIFDTVPLAMCKAIEKLINGEKDAVLA